MSIVEGESLINDGTALVAYRFAVVAVVSGSFSLWEAGLEFVYSVSAGIAIGLAVGWLIRQLRRRLDNPPLEITIALLSGYLAYIPAELVHASAVLAAVTVGIYMGAHTSELTTARTRVQGDAVWEIVVFLLNALLFVLIGLQLPVILDELSGQPTGTLLVYGVIVSATGSSFASGDVAVTYLPRFLSRRIRERDPYPPWQHPAFVSWAGMRGAVSLAAALALPLATDAGDPFPGRDLILYLAFCVILATLVGQGLTMPLVIHLLGLESDRHLEAEEARARIRAAEAALARLEELVEEDWVPSDTAERLRGLYAFAMAGSGQSRPRHRERTRGAAAGLRAPAPQLLDAEREALEELRREGVITEQVLQRVVRDLDLEDLRLDPGGSGETVAVPPESRWRPRCGVLGRPRTCSVRGLPASLHHNLQRAPATSTVPPDPPGSGRRQVSQPTPSRLPSKPCGSAPTTLKCLCGTSEQSRSGGYGGMQTVGIRRVAAAARHEAARRRVLLTRLNLADTDRGPFPGTRPRARAAPPSQPSRPRAAGRRSGPRRRRRSTELRRPGGRARG